jgi:hypothetical protein
MIVVLGDQVDSRNEENRQEQIQAVYARIGWVNDALGDRLAVPLSVSRGDEIQCLVAGTDEAWDVVEAFDSAGRGGAFRYAIGIGGLTTSWESSTWDMDGPCFHNARDAMERAKKERRWVAVQGFGERRDSMVDGLVRTLQVVREGWTDRQRQAYAERRGSSSQLAAAERMKVDQSTLSKMLKSAHYNSYMESERALRALMRMLFFHGDIAEAP